MKYLGNKGQGAMEYLMTYGWAILVVMIVGVVLWQLGVFNVGQGSIVVTGFVKMQPLTPSIVYRDENFSASFTNALGTSIRLGNITLLESIYPQNCTGSLAHLSALTVKAGGTFTVNGTGCPPKADGDPYDMIVTIPYLATMGGITSQHTDIGHVKGQAEPVS
jgi:hypothetical protein